MLILFMLTSACGNDDRRSDDATLTSDQFCEALWDEGLAPADWDHSQFMRDCLTALEAGFRRDVIVDIYEEIKADGG